MTEPKSDKNKDPSPGSSERARATRIWTRKDLYVVVTGVIASGITAVAGVADVPDAAMFVMGCAITAAAALATRALTVRTLRQRLNALWLALGTTTLILVGVFIYQTWLDPASQQISLLVNGEDVEVWRPAITPGGSLDRYAYSPVSGGRTVNIQCLTQVDNQEGWYLLETGGWLPQSALTPMPGLPKPDVPLCE